MRNFLSLKRSISLENKVKPELTTTTKKRSHDYYNQHLRVPFLFLFYKSEQRTQVNNDHCFGVLRLVAVHRFDCIRHNELTAIFIVVTILHTLQHSTTQLLLKSISEIFYCNRIGCLKIIHYLKLSNKYLVWLIH